MTWKEPQKNQKGKSRRHSEVSAKNQLSTTLRTPIISSKPFDISKIEENVNKYTLEYQNKFGTGPCGPVAPVILDGIRNGSLSGLFKNGDDIHNWRLAFTPYKGKHVHYVVAHIKKEKPDLIIDATNFFDTQDATVRIVTPLSKEWKDYVESGDGYDDFEVFKDGEDITSACDLYNKEDIDFWRKKLK